MREPVSRLWRHVRPVGECLEYVGKRSKGYGLFSIRGKRMYAHRFAWRVQRGAIPAGLGVLHHCDNPPCVRIEHLFLGTQADNARDMWAKGRANHARGERGGSAKLNRQQVLAIRHDLAVGVSVPALAAEYAVSEATIYAIRNRDNWAWLEPAA